MDVRYIVHILRKEKNAWKLKQLLFHHHCCHGQHSRLHMRRKVPTTIPDKHDALRDMLYCCLLGCSSKNQWDTWLLIKCGFCVWIFSCSYRHYVKIRVSIWASCIWYKTTQSWTGTEWWDWMELSEESTCQIQPFLVVFYQKQHFKQVYVKLKLGQLYWSSTRNLN